MIIGAEKNRKQKRKGVGQTFQTMDKQINTHRYMHV